MNSQRKKLKLLGGILIMAGLATLGWFTVTAPVSVMVVRPQRGELVESVFGTGTLEAKVVVGVSSKMVGKVVKVLADQGDTVTAGQPLARLEAKDYEDAVRVAEAQVHQMDAEQTKAQLDLERARALRRDQTIAQAEFDKADMAYRVAEARRHTAEEELGVAQARLADTRILSPVAGLVVTRNLEVGATVVPGSPIFRVADTQVVWVQAQVDESETGKLAPGQPVRVVFRCCPDKAHAGSVARLHREADRVTEELTVDVTVTQLPPHFFLGQKADVYIETARKADALQIPKTVLRDGGVLVMDNGWARWRHVTFGLVGRETVEVTDGLRETDQIVAAPVVGKKPLADGQRVKATL